MNYNKLLFFILVLFILFSMSISFADVILPN